MPELAERVYNGVVDKSDWGDGAWQDEPDKVQWIDEATDLDCMIKRNAHLGNWCGYVAVPPGHPWHGLPCDDVDADVEVHGGLTYGSACQEDVPEAEGICHVPAPGRAADVWWFGFDCGHFMDLMPGLIARERQMGFPVPPALLLAYRDVAYVRAECSALAAQLALVTA